MAPVTSTPVIVGPGSYLKKPVNYFGEYLKPASTSNLLDEPAWSIPKGPKLGKGFEGWDKNQTYDTKTRAVGTQVNSRKNTLPSYSVGKSQRDAKTGYFKSVMEKQPSRVRIEHPKI